MAHSTRREHALPILGHSDTNGKRNMVQTTKDGTPQKRGAIRLSATWRPSVHLRVVEVSGLTAICPPVDCPRVGSHPADRGRRAQIRRLHGQVYSPTRAPARARLCRATTSGPHGPDRGSAEPARQDGIGHCSPLLRPGDHGLPAVHDPGRHAVR